MRFTVLVIWRMELWKRCFYNILLNGKYVEGENIMLKNDKNNKKPIIQTSGYNGSEPTRVCPNCGEEKLLSELGYRNMGDGNIRNQSWCKSCR